MKACIFRALKTMTIKKKAGAQAKGKRALTKAEQQQRIRARVRIINEEMAKIGVVPVPMHMPAVYLEALRAFEADFQTNPSMAKVIIYTSSWVCKIVEDFVERQAKLMPDSKVANIFNSNRWVSRKDIDFGTATNNALIEIDKFEQQHERELT